MLACLNPLREITFSLVALRMVIAMICGGLIGLERELRRRPAGFRTHILIAAGASMTTMTSQYMFTVQNYYTDPARLGAQVIAGISFIGAGTIIVTRRQSVKGLTTAAGLWAAAIIGLCIGAGFYEGGVLAALMVLFTEAVLVRYEYLLLDKAPQINLYVTYNGAATLDSMLYYCRSHEIKVLDLEITRNSHSLEDDSYAIISLRLNRGFSVAKVINGIQSLTGVTAVEEL